MSLINILTPGSSQVVESKAENKGFKSEESNNEAFSSLIDKALNDKKDDKQASDVTNKNGKKTSPEATASAKESSQSEKSDKTDVKTDDNALESNAKSDVKSDAKANTNPEADKPSVTPKTKSLEVTHQHIDGNQTGELSTSQHSNSEQYSSATPQKAQEQSASSNDELGKAAQNQTASINLESVKDKSYQTTDNSTHAVSWATSNDNTSANAHGTSDNQTIDKNQNVADELLNFLGASDNMLSKVSKNTDGASIDTANTLVNGAGKEEQLFQLNGQQLSRSQLIDNLKEQGLSDHKILQLISELDKLQPAQLIASHNFSDLESIKDNSFNTEEGTVELTSAIALLKSGKTVSDDAIQQALRKDNNELHFVESTKEISQLIDAPEQPIGANTADIREQTLVETPVAKAVKEATAQDLAYKEPLASEQAKAASISISQQMDANTIKDDQASKGEAKAASIGNGGEPKLSAEQNVSQIMQNTDDSKGSESDPVKAVAKGIYGATDKAQVASSQKVEAEAISEEIVLENDEQQIVNSLAEKSALLKASGNAQVEQLSSEAQIRTNGLPSGIAGNTANASDLHNPIRQEQLQAIEQVNQRVMQDSIQLQRQPQVATETISILRKDFADAVKDKVMVMVNQKLNQIDIQLDPPELGNVHVRVNLQNEQASVSFVVQNQQAKEALEQHMGRLRDMLNDSGVDVGDANVSQQNSSSNEEAGQEQQLANDNYAGEEESQASTPLMAQLNKSTALGVDFYA